MADWPSTWVGLEKLRSLKVLWGFWDPEEARMILLRSTFAFFFQTCLKAGDGDSSAGPRCECEWLVCVLGWTTDLSRL